MKQIRFSDLPTSSQVNEADIFPIIQEEENKKAQKSSINDYNDFKNKPRIEGNSLEGDLTLEDLGAQSPGEYLTEEKLLEKELVTKIDLGNKTDKNFGSENANKYLGVNEIGEVAPIDVTFSNDNKIIKKQEGNPLIITDSFDASIKNIEIYGQSEQASTTGAQLLSLDMIAHELPYSDNGITFSDNGDGGIKVTGTATGIASLFFNNIINNLEDGETYSYNSDTKLGVLKIEYNDGTPIEYFPRVTVNKSKMISIKPYIQYTSGNTVNKVLYPMLNKGSTALPFEPYTGGKPSPSPEYPQEIISKEVSEIKVTGANLFDFVTLAGGEGATFEKNGLSARIENGYLITTGTAINDAFTNIIMINVPPEKRTIFPAGTYQLGRGDKGMASLTIGVTTVSGKGPVNYSSVFTTDEPFYINYFYVAYALGQNANGEKIPFGMTYGSEPLYEYEPYIEPQVINLTSPITLRGIPVDNGGNVTIDGQQYVSDVITEKDGVIGVDRHGQELLVSSMNKFSMNKFYLTLGTHTNGQPYLSCYNENKDTYLRNMKPLCNRYIGSLYTTDNGKVYIPNEKGFIINDNRFTDIDTAISIITDEETKVLLPLLNSTFEPLPDEIQTQYKALKSYYPNTVINTNCWTSLNYEVSLQSFIEETYQKIKEINNNNNKLLL